MRLEKEFFQRGQVTKIARELLGMKLCTQIGGVLTVGRIVETEAYSWKERGCHAYRGKKTNRTQVMFNSGGCVYVYLCYGMHHLFNIVTNVEGLAEAVLIRAVEPVLGVDWMKKRRGVVKKEVDLSAGPGKLTKALGIDRTFNGKYLFNSEIWVENEENSIFKPHVEVSTRIGIAYAGDDALLPWRFSIKDNLWVSKMPRGRG